MIYSIRDIELLRLLRWCRYITVKDLRRVFDDTTVQNLKAAKLIRQGTSRRAQPLAVSNKQFFAVRQENGTHRYFAAGHEGGK